MYTIGGWMKNLWPLYQVRRVAKQHKECPLSPIIHNLLISFHSPCDACFNELLTWLIISLTWVLGLCGYSQVYFTINVFRVTESARFHRTAAYLSEHIAHSDMWSSSPDACIERKVLITKQLVRAVWETIRSWNYATFRRLTDRLPAPRYRVCEMQSHISPLICSIT